ncbi:hypothetical protein F2Q68_00011855 [Brassica cretica]|uniref:Uncharacterized protein n=1 Tax=Brassica cretica TaxID=69181 RepID=A0A8S9KZR8_BRACR|nr:hypothetical protein F2Q68_00011855 [Brassica cretica]
MDRSRGGSAGGEARCSKLKRWVVFSRNKASFLRSGSDLGVNGLSGVESVAASPGTFLSVLQTLCCRFVILCCSLPPNGTLVIRLLLRPIIPFAGKEVNVIDLFESNL